MNDRRSRKYISMLARARAILAAGCWPDAAVLEAVQAYGGTPRDAAWVCRELNIPAPDPVPVGPERLTTARPSTGYALHHPGRVDFFG